MAQTNIIFFMGASPTQTGVQTPQINKRFWNKSSLNSWLIAAKSASQGFSKQITVDYEVYSSDNFVDIPLSSFNENIDTSTKFYGNFNNISFIEVDSKFSDGGSINTFFAFIINYEVNHIDKSIRFFFMIDWWDTLLYNDIEVNPTGEVERAHINDLISGTQDNKYATVYGRTSDLDYPIYNNDIQRKSRLATNKFANVYTYKNSDGESKAKANDMALAMGATEDLAFLYLLWKNTADIEEEDGRDESISVSIKLTHPDIEQYKNIGNNMVISSAGIVRVIPFNKKEGRIMTPSETSDGKNVTVSTIGSWELASLTNETLLAFRISNELPAGCKLYRGYDINTFGHYEWNTQLKLVFDGDNSVAVQHFKVGTTGGVTSLLKLKGSFGAHIVDIVSLFDDELYFDNDIVEMPSGYENYLSTITKSKMYPYDYLSLKCGDIEKVINTLMYNETDMEIQVVEHYTIGDVVYYVPNSLGYVDDYLSISHISLNSIFPPYFVDSWLDRINALEQGAMTAIKAGLSLVGGGVAAATGAGQLENASSVLGQVAGAGAVAGGVMQVVSGAINMGYSIHRFAREYRLRDEGYYQTGNISAIDLSSYINANVIVACHTSLFDKSKRRIRDLIAKYGETTTLFVDEILQNHQRTHFNYIQTKGCVCRPDSPVNIVPLKDIERMFDSGVYLFTYVSGDTRYTPATAFSVDGVVNYQENFAEKEN